MYLCVFAATSVTNIDKAMTDELKKSLQQKIQKDKKEVHTKYSTKLKFDYIECETYFQSEWARIGGLQVQSVQFNSHNGFEIILKQNMSKAWLQERVIFKSK